MQLGPVRFSIDGRTQAGRRPFERRLVVREAAFSLEASEETPALEAIYAALAKDKPRNEMILNDVIRADPRTGGWTLPDPADRAQGPSRVLRDSSAARGAPPGRASGRHGGQGSPRGSCPTGGHPGNEERLVVATGRYLGEGFDEARLDTLFLAMSASWKTTLVQYTGRFHRLHPAKSEVPDLRLGGPRGADAAGMFQKRLRGCLAIDYARGEEPLGYAEPPDEPVIEYDDDGARDQEDDVG